MTHSHLSDIRLDAVYAGDGDYDENFSSFDVITMR